MERGRARGLALVCLTAAGLLASPSSAEEVGQQPTPPPADNAPQTPPPAEPPSRAPEDVPLVDLSRIETDSLRLLYFDPAETYLTPWVGRSFHNALRVQEDVFGWRPWDKTTVLLKDFSDYGNAAARSSPNNALIIDVAPLSQAFETFSAGERFYTLMNHELVHVATMDVWNEDDARWRRFFGGKPMPLQDHPESILYNFLATPRVNVPRWYLEGSAVFMETWMAGGYGRAQGAYDEMVFRAMVRDGAHFYSPVGLESEGTAIDFQVGVNDYLYGTRFFSYLALEHSPEKVIQWLRRDDDSAGYYARQFRRVFGRPLNAVWAEWAAWERRFQTANLEAIRAHSLTDAAYIGDRALGSVSRAFVTPGGELVGAFRYPGVIGHVGALSLANGDIRRLVDIKGAMLYRVTSLAYDPGSNTAWYTTDNYAYRDIVELDVESGATRTLLRDARIGDLVFNPKDRSLWGLRHLNGYVTLVRMPEPRTSWNQVHTFDFGEIPFDLDISPDGTLLSASFGEVDGKQSVRIYRLEDLLAGGATATAQFDLGASTPEGFVFSPDGRYLYGSAYYTGVSNIFRYELATGALEAVSNAETGYFRPVPRADGSLIVYEYAGDGFRPAVIQPAVRTDLGTIKFLGAEIASQHPVVKTWAAGAPTSVPFDDLVTERGKYNPREEMRLGAAYPVVEGYKGHAAFGYHAIFEDPLQFSQFTATATWSPDTAENDEALHVDIAYRSLRWRARFWHNDADFYDLFGPTERARAGNALIVGRKQSFVYDPPRQLDFDAELAVYQGLDTLPAAQDVQTGFRNLASFSANLSYTDTTKSLGAVDHEKGWRWNLGTAVDYARDAAFPSVHAGIDFGRPLPIRNSSIWLYTAAGANGGPRGNPLGSSYFGAFRNNYVDDREVKRYREYDTFPGFDINEIDARTFARALGEWNAPPVRFRDVGSASLYLGSARSAVFAGALVAEPAFGARRNLQTVGAQIDFNFTVALRLPMVLSLGYAYGFEDGEKSGEEALLSLKIM